MFYQGGLRVPLIIRWPERIKPGTTTGEQVFGIDFYPTFLDVAGIEKPDNYQLDGLSLTPLFDNPEASLVRNAMYWHFPGYPNSPWRTTPVSVIRSGKWKLMKFYETKEVKLYNLEKDTGEEHNLADRMPERRDALLNQLNRCPDAPMARQF